MDQPFIQWLPVGHKAPADLAVLIVSWNVCEYVLKNLETLASSRGSITAECIVIDNASSDKTVEAIRERFPWVSVIANQDNVGFSRANNQGLAQAQAHHILLLNPDMRVEPDALQKTVEYLDAHPEVGVVGGALITAEGGMLSSVRHFPDVWSQVVILLKLPHLFPHILDTYLWNTFDYTREQSVDVVRGSYFGMNRTAIEKLGGLDERYFIWFEEVDYCKQVLNAGLKVMFVPTIHATDLVGKSFSQTRRYLGQKRFSRSLIQYFQKWHPGWRVYLLRAASFFGLGGNWLWDQWMALRGTKEYHRART